MMNFLGWYLTVTIVGWLAFLLAFRWLGKLPDRGYSLSRTLGILLWGYVYWLLATLGIIPNQVGGIWFALAILAAFSGWMIFRFGRSDVSGMQAWRAGWQELMTWLRTRWSMVVGVECLFFISFGVMALIRATNPEIFGTEKPMEIAFINATLRSDFFPPRDPWLSGYAISYYYFGYVIVAMLAKFTSTIGSVAFNLGLALTFSLTASGAYGLVFNLVNLSRNKLGNSTVNNNGSPIEPKSTLIALSGPFMVLLVSNIEGFLEILHARGFLPASFWNWLGIQDINVPPAAPYVWQPRLFGTGNWWWWRASRVVQDFDFHGAPREVIDEFPVFSYLLGDLHPHVLAMPFAFLAMAFALNVLLGGGESHQPIFRRDLNFRVLAWGSMILFGVGGISLVSGLIGLNLVAALIGLLLLIGSVLIYLYMPVSVRRTGVGILQRADLGVAQINIPFSLEVNAWLPVMLVLGGMAFLNTWDFPFYVLLFSLAYTARRLVVFSEIKLGEFLRNLVSIGLLLSAGGVFLYLPFYLSFSSQAGGILPNLIYPTRGAHLWVMYAVFLVPILGYVIFLGKKSAHSGRLRTGFAVAGVVFLGIWFLSILLGVAILSVPGISELYLSSIGAQVGDNVLAMAITRRFLNLGGWITLLCLSGLVIARFLPMLKPPDSQTDATHLTSANIFTLLLILMGALLVSGAEFFFLRDQFGWRINTIFKFYYQAWLFWGIAAAYSLIYLTSRLRGLAGRIFLGFVLLVLLMGLVYTLYGMWDKTHGFNPPGGWSLDGAVFLEAQSPDEYAAIRWLQSAPEGVITEAVGGSYSPAGHGRVSAFTGLPTVLGWPGHESQWRGGSVEQGSRQADIQRLYCGRDWGEAQLILEQYNVRYVYLGPLERATYTQQTCGTGLNEEIFRRFMNTVFRLGDVAIYEVTWVDRLGEPDL